MEFSDKRILWADPKPQEYDPLYDLICDLVGKNNMRQVETELAALNALKTDRFDLFITGLFLPRDRKEFNKNQIRLNAGVRVIKKLRGNTTWETMNYCPVMVFTSCGNSSRCEWAQELVGRNGVLIWKPERTQVILDEIRKLLIIPLTYKQLGPMDFD